MGGLANSLTSSEKAKIYEECKKYLIKDDRLSKNFINLSETDKEWVLNCLSSSKGTIPCKLITDFDSLNISPDKDFFEIHQFYSNMKDSVISDEDYNNVKKFYKLLKMSNLGELNKVYNFQDTIIFCEIFEQRSDLFKKILKYNPRKCKSASSFSGCMHRNKSKCCTALPQMQILPGSLKKRFGGLSCINTRLAFDTNIIVNDPGKEKVIAELNIDGKNN